MINLQQIHDYIVYPAVRCIEGGTAPWVASIQLVMGTGLTESEFRHIDQVDKANKPGPAVSFWQIEKATHDDVWRNWLAYRSDIRGRLTALLVPDSEPFWQMHWNLKYAAAMCRVIYMRVKEKLPVSGDAQGMANYHKKYYNTYLGKTDPQKSVVHFERIIQLGF